MSTENQRILNLLKVYNGGKYDNDASFNKLFKVLPDLILLLPDIDVEIIKGKTFYGVDIYIKNRVLSLIQYTFYSTGKNIGISSMPLDSFSFTHESDEPLMTIALDLLQQVYTYLSDSL